MKLIGSLTSPYTRLVRVTLAELGLEHEFEVTAPFGRLDAAQSERIDSLNPLMKVPILAFGGERLLDSRVILMHLLRGHARPGQFGAGFPESAQRENQLSVVYGVIESGILRFLFINSHPEVNADAGYMARSLKRMQVGLGWLDRELPRDDTFGPPEAMLVCGLEWFSKRNIVDWSVYPNLVACHARHANRPSLAGSRIPKEI